MAVVKVKAGRAIEKIKLAFVGVSRDLQLYVNIINFAVERIKAKARLSKRMEANGTGDKRLPNLSKSYVDHKAKLTPGENGTDPDFFLPDSRVSNLTYTGQLLESINGRVIEQGPDRGRIGIEVTGNRRDGKITNKELYNKLVDKNPNYQILSLDKKAISLIRNQILQRLRRELVKLKLK